MTASEALERPICLTFRLGEEMFAVEVLKVQEVLGFKTVTKIPGVPDYVRGIINLRGTVVPIVDLRMKFSMGETVQNKSACVIVLVLDSGDDRILIGALADSVHEVVEFDQNQLEPPPRIGSEGPKRFIQGIGKRNEQFIILLDINRIFSSKEYALLGAATESGSAEKVTAGPAEENAARV